MFESLPFSQRKLTKEGEDHGKGTGLVFKDNKADCSFTFSMEI